MRIMQVNSFPIRQNRIAFKGEEKELSLSEQIEKVKAEQEDKGLFAQAEAAYLEINGKACEKIYGGSTSKEVVDAFVDSGRAYARSIMREAFEQDATAQMNAAEKIANLIKAFGALNDDFPNLEIRNSLLVIWDNLPRVFQKIDFSYAFVKLKNISK